MKLAIKPAILPLLLLGGCTAASTSTIAAAGGGIAVGAVTANPAVAIGIGLAIRAAADAGLAYYGRVRQNGEQNAIADVAGPLPVGGRAPWVIHHTIPLGDEQGELLVVRDLTTRLAECKEVIFTVQDGPDRSLYTTQVCRRGDRWKWAAAEPAVPRWGYLQ